MSEGNSVLAAKVAKVIDVSTGIWISSRSLVPSISTHLQEAQTVQKQTGQKQIVPLVVYDLPDRDCAAGASQGEFSSANGGEAKYQEYITAVASQIRSFSDVSVAVILEPDSIGNLVSNQGIAFCASGAPVQKRSLAYAISILGALPTVSIYLDAAHATWLGWPDNLAPTAKVVGDIYAAAKQLNPNAIARGLSTDDQGRSGNQNVTRRSTDWCNFRYAGLGIRPTASTGNSLLDAILWVKPPGESDGNSNPTSSHYDINCASNTSYIPSPDPGSWISGAFRSMVELATPPL
ncbi:glycoside hydrolase family 6 protein [Ceratobasidium sp. AG-Ba]|nr:glycoside hydrolase family 6 protein [Ceratobasidium sp. AG-Ba]